MSIRAQTLQALTFGVKWKMKISESLPLKSLVYGVCYSIDVIYTEMCIYAG